MKKIFPLLLVILLFGCMKDGKESTTNGNFKIDLLFEHNGCKMYRFVDNGRPVYWSDCSGTVQQYMGSKSVIKQQTITTK